MDAMAVRAGEARRGAPWRLKDVERHVERLEADNFNRALRINYLEEQLLAHERRLAPGARDLAEEVQQLREAVQMRDAELAEAYGKLASLEAVARRRRLAERERAVAQTEALEAARARAEALEQARRELETCGMEKEELLAAAREAEQSRRTLEDAVEALEQRACRHEQDARARRRADREERERLGQELKEQTAKAAALRVEAGAWRSKYMEAGSELAGLRATVAGYKRTVERTSEEAKRFKVALAKAKGAQRKAASRDEAICVLLEQLKQTQRLIEATEARMSRMDSRRQRSNSERGEAASSSSAFSTLSAIQRDIREIERALTAKARA